jgi:signal transduction histidine kinase
VRPLDTFRLRRLVAAIGVTVALVTATSIPAGYMLAAMLKDAELLVWRAELAAGHVARYAYSHGPLWPYHRVRLAEIISYAMGTADAHEWRIYGPDGRLMMTEGSEQISPTYARGAVVVVAGEVVGRVEVVQSLRPILRAGALVGLYGVLLGLAAWLTVYVLPLRVLDRTLTDLTRARDDALEAKNAAELAERSKANFLANTSHELRTPLNAIIGFSEILQQQMFGSIGDPRYREYAGDINHSGRHLLAVINDLLDMSKIDAGQLELNREQIDLVEVAAGCRRLVAERAERAGVDLVADWRPDLTVPLLADQVRLKQILLNLLSNAIKFTPIGGRVEIALRNGVDWAEIVVRDTGIGMRSEDILIAMRPFRQVDSSLARQQQGTGLGLPITKRLVELHCGELRVESAPGAGTAVTVRLPSRRPDTSVVRAAPRSVDAAV